jgi:hypothetical protein
VKIWNRLRTKPLQHRIAVVIDNLHGDPSGIWPVEGAVSKSLLIAIIWIIKQSE